MAVWGLPIKYGKTIVVHAHLPSFLRYDIFHFTFKQAAIV